MAALPWRLSSYSGIISSCRDFLKRTLNKRTGSAEWQVCPPGARKKWPAGEPRCGSEWSAAEGQWVGTSVRMLKLTACVHMGVCVCPPRMRLVLACVNTNISEDRPSSRSCYHSMFGSTMLKCLCRWEAQVSILLGARTAPAWRPKPPPSLHLPQREPRCAREGQGWKSSKTKCFQTEF